MNNKAANAEDVTPAAPEPSLTVALQRLLPAEIIAHYEGGLPASMTLAEAIDQLDASMPDSANLAMVALVDVGRANKIAAQHVAWACIRAHLPKE